MRGGGNNAGIAASAVWQLQHLLHERAFVAAARAAAAEHHPRGRRAAAQPRGTTGAVNELEHAKSAATTMVDLSWRRGRR